MATVKSIISSADKACDGFEKVVASVETKMFREAITLMQSLELDTKGNIKTTIGNLKKLSSIKAKLNKVAEDPVYKAAVSDFVKAFAVIQKQQNDYFSQSFPDKTLSENAKNRHEAMKVIAVENTVEGLSTAGVKANVTDKLNDMLLKAVTTGASFADLQEDVRRYLVGQDGGTGALSRYATTYSVTSLSQFTGQNNKLLTDDLGVEWFMYVGSTMERTREFCQHMTAKKWVHISEIPEILKGHIEYDGETYKCKIYAKTKLPSGMIEGTNEDNFQVNVGGWNCRHQLVPVANAAVPMELRKKFEVAPKEPIELSDEQKASVARLEEFIASHPKAIKFKEELGKIKGAAMSGDGKKLQELIDKAMKALRKRETDDAWHKEKMAAKMRDPLDVLDKERKDKYIELREFFDKNGKSVFKGSFDDIWKFIESANSAKDDAEKASYVGMASSAIDAVYDEVFAVMTLDPAHKTKYDEVELFLNEHEGETDADILLIKKSHDWAKKIVDAGIVGRERLERIYDTIDVNHDRMSDYVEAHKPLELTAEQKKKVQYIQDYITSHPGAAKFIDAISAIEKAAKDRNQTVMDETIEKTYKAVRKRIMDEEWRKKHKGGKESEDGTAKAAEGDVRTGAEELIKKLDGIKDVDISALKAAVKSGDDSKIKSAVKAVDPIVRRIEALTKLDNPYEVARKWSLKDAEIVNKAVTDRMARESFSTLEKKKSWLESEMLWTETHKKYETWSAVRDAYKKELEEVEKEIRLGKRAAIAHEAISWIEANTVDVNLRNKAAALRVDLESVSDIDDALSKKIDDLVAEYEKAKKEIEKWTKLYDKAEDAILFAGSTNDAGYKTKANLVHDVLKGRTGSIKEAEKLVNDLISNYTTLKSIEDAWKQVEDRSKSAIEYASKAKEKTYKAKADKLKAVIETRSATIDAANKLADELIKMYGDEHGVVTVEMLQAEMGNKLPKTLSELRKALDEYAYTDSNLKKDEDRINAIMKQLFDDNDLGMDINHYLLGSVLEKGFLNTFQSGTSKGYCGSHKTSGKIEERHARLIMAHKMFDPDQKSKIQSDSFVGNQLKREEYEKYGHLIDRDKYKSITNNLTWYGDVQIRFKRDKVITTWTFNDSLHTHGHYFQPSLTTDPKVESFNQMGGSRVINSKHTDSLYEWQRENGTSYVELQYHGKVTMDMVESITFQKNPELYTKVKTGPDDLVFTKENLKTLIDMGIEIYYVDGGRVVRYKPKS